MALTVAPGTVYYPLGLVVDTGGTASTAGKLTSHRVREACLRYETQSTVARTVVGGIDGNGVV